MTDKPNPLAKQLTIFERMNLKKNLVARVMRALRDCPDDEMRAQIIQEVAQLASLIPKKEEGR